MNTFILLVSLGVLFAGGALCALLGSRTVWANRLGWIVSVTGAVLALYVSARVLWNGQCLELRWSWSIPFGTFYLAIDSLSAFFIVVIAIVCGLASVYGMDYLKKYSGQKNLGFFWFFYNILFASMLLVVMARNGILFLMAWELMALSSFFLVMFEHEQYKVREAGWTYLVATHLGTAFLLVLFVLLSQHGQAMDFDLFSVPSTTASSSILFLLAVVGFGTKAGFMPMHVWLPEAHPAAPSHVSAVMSGVMIKTGIYGLLRILTFLGSPATWPLWWGWVLIGIGIVSGVGGVLFALAQHDLKRLLAYHSVENIGIICLGLGLWLLGTSIGSPTVATLGFLGGLLHVWNHAIFKSLLFLGIGAVAQQTGTRDIEQLGGLLKRMRYTGLSFLIGSAAICGLPPLNGFVSEILIYLGAFSGLAAADQPQAAVASMIVVGAMALIGGLAVACFTKVFGIVFLGEPRSESAGSAHEVSGFMSVPIGILAALCVLIGLLGPFVITAMNSLAVEWLPQAKVSIQDSTRLLGMVSASAVILVMLILGLWIVRRRLLAGRIVERSGTWDCGYAAPTPRMQYTASSFAWPILDMFRFFLQSRVKRQLPTGLFPDQAKFESHTEDVFNRFLYTPLFHFVGWLADRLRWIQQGSNHLYVLYIALALVVLLLWKLGISQ